jgi:rhomboid-like protein
MLTIFLGGAVFSSLVSHLFKLALLDISPSLGASGGVFALVAATTYLNPNSRLAIIFFPFIDFSAGTLLPVLVTFDVVGCLALAARRRLFGLDHAAHLGGVAFGTIFLLILLTILGWFYTKWFASGDYERTRRWRE